MEEIDLKDLFQMFWNKRIQILIVILIFMVLGIIYTVGFVTPVYTSSAKVVLATNGNNSNMNNGQMTTNDLNMNAKLVDTYSVILKSDSVIREVISNLGIRIDENSLKKNIEVSSIKGTEVIKIAVTNENQYTAEKITNEITKVFMDKVKEIYKLENVQILDKAEVPVNPSNVHHSKDVIIFTFVGIVVSCMYIFIVNMLDTTVKSAEQIENDYKIPVLATIPLREETIEITTKKQGKKSNTTKSRNGGRK